MAFSHHGDPRFPVLRQIPGIDPDPFVSESFRRTDGRCHSYGVKLHFKLPFSSFLTARYDPDPVYRRGAGKSTPIWAERNGKQVSVKPPRPEKSFVMTEDDRPELSIS